MPKLTVEGFDTVDVEAGKRLVLAIEQDAGVDILHACGGNARCTTCRVEFISGEPTKMTERRRRRRTAQERGLQGVRLSCQIVCDHDMTRARDQPARRQRPARSGQDAGADDSTAAGMDLTLLRFDGPRRRGDAEGRWPGLTPRLRVYASRRE